MRQLLSHLAWLDKQHDQLTGLVQRWSDINTGTGNLAGLTTLTGEIGQRLAAMGAAVEQIELPLREVIDDCGGVAHVAVGPALVARMRPMQARRVLLVIHTDTVYGADHAFQRCRWADDHTLIGPGVADAKGGIVVMLAALEAIERSGVAGELGWTVVLNPDEEVGSPSSAALLEAEARRHDVGLVFEPALTPEGMFASERGGSGNFVLVLHGRAAHVGRAFAEGRSATVALAHAVAALDRLNRDYDGVIVNIGRISGGEALNVVPDLAIARVNVRVSSVEHEQQVLAAVTRIIADLQQHDGIHAELHGRFHCPPKPFDDATRSLFEQLRGCGEAIGVPVTWQRTGGVCDGNKLAAAGLPTIDTLGPRGGAIHSDREFIIVDSLIERAKLAALLLLTLATHAPSQPEPQEVSP